MNSKTALLLLATSLALSLSAPASAQDQAAPMPAQVPAPTAKPAPPPTPDKRDEIIVTASPFAHNLADTPAITAVVSSEEILRAGGSSIADALSKVPGVSGTGFAAGASRPIIRGMDANRVRILEDGTSVSDVSDIGPDHGVPIDPLSARRIEVVRGAGTLRYGSQAIGGVINAINNRVPARLATDKPVQGELTGSYDSVANTGQGSALADITVNQLALHIDGFYRDAGDYDTPLGKQVNSFFRGNGQSAGASYFFGNNDASHIGAAVTHYAAKYGIPSDDTFIDMKQTKVVTKSSFALGNGLLDAFNVDGSFADYQHSEVAPDGTIATTFKNKEYNGRAELLFNKLGFVSNSALGVEYQHRDFNAVGEDSSYLFPATLESVAGYVFTDSQLTDALHLEVSGRVENVRITGTPLSDVFTRRSDTPLSGAVGALYKVSDAVKLGLVFSSTGRVPALTELFARGGHDGPATYETGDPGLRLERANSLEASLRVNSGAFQFEGSIYSSWFDNYIYGDLTGRTCDDDGVCMPGFGEELKELFYRQQGAHFRGLEGKASYAIIDDSAGKLDASVLGDYTRATLDDGSNVPRIPPYRIGGGLDWQGNSLDAGVSLIWSGKQDRVGAFDTPTRGYADVGAQVSWRPFANYEGIEFAVVGQNLANEVERNAAALNKDVVVGAGRNVRFVVKVATF